MQENWTKKHYLNGVRLTLIVLVFDKIIIVRIKNFILKIIVLRLKLVMKKSHHLILFSFFTLFSLNSFSTTTTPLQLNLNKTPATQTTNTSISTSVATTPVIVLKNSEDLQQNDTPLTIAVASNFKLTAQHIAQQFSKTFGIQVTISSASTSTLYQQILYGAPFDLFLSADEKHVQLLVGNGRAAQHAGFVYAQGQLVFWQPNAKQTLSVGDLMQYNGRLAIANPKFAPYGVAAKQTLQAIDKWDSLQYVKGNNINQAYQFVESGNIPAGLVSHAAVVQKHQKNYIIISQKWYQPIKQVGIILNNNRLEESDLFRQFLLSDSIQLYIKSQGYN